MNTEKIGINISKLRTERGITQEQLGRDIGLTASAISNIECGRSVPSVDTLCRFSELFGVKVDSIISDSSESDLSRLEMEEKLVTVDRYLSEINKPVWIRHVLVPGGSDNDEQLRKLNEFINTLNNVDRVQVLPYHSLGTFKWEQLGIDYPLKGVEPPTKERIENAQKLLHISEYNGYLSR